MLFQQNAPLLSAQANQVNDSQPGTSFTSPTGGQPFRGIVGQAWQWTDEQAALHSNTTVGTLYGGIYMYVQTLSSASAAVGVGRLAFWSSAANRASFIVTTDPTTALTQIAGVFVNSTLTLGNYGIIQIAGLASVLCKASVTDTTAGDIGFAVSDSSIGKVDANLPGSATAAQQAVKVGVFLDAPANGAVKRLWLAPSILSNCY